MEKKYSFSPNSFCPCMDGVVAVTLSVSTVCSTVVLHDSEVLLSLHAFLITLNVHSYSP